MSEAILGQTIDGSRIQEFEHFTVESFSRGKIKADPGKNEDSLVVTPTTFAVIDGATSNGIISFEGKSEGQFASRMVAEALRTADPQLFGRELVDFVTDHLAKALKKWPHSAVFEESPELRGTAVFTAARIIEEQMIVTQIGDVAFRVNGVKLHSNDLKIDDVHAKKRIEIIKAERQAHPDLSEEELLKRGREAVVENIKYQFAHYKNNSNSPFGYGAIDGTRVPDEYITFFTFNLSDIETLEIFSDGYFRVADAPTIESWEEYHEYVERVDPAKIKDFPSTKGSSKDSLTDDRTVLIYKKK